MSQYYIMNAGILFNNKTVSVEQVAEELGDDEQTILVVRRETGFDKYVKLFVSGAGVGYEASPPSDNPISTTYTQDTGNGYANKNKSLLIDNIITTKDGKVTDTGNGIGINEKRRVWVMK